MNLLDFIPERGSEKRVVQDNALISAAYTLTLQEKRLLLLGISKVGQNDYKHRHTEDFFFTVTNKEWQDVFKISDKNSYNDMKKAAKLLWDRSILIKQSDERIKLRWVTACGYNDGEASISLQFNPIIMAHLSGMLDEFTSYKLLSVSGLKSIHSIRIYELASQFVNTGVRVLSVDELKEMLALSDSYSSYADLKRYVLDKSVAEISSKTDIKLTWKPIKMGRKVVSIRFNVKKKDQIEMF